MSFSVDPGPSGLGQFEASVDGAPMTITGTDAAFVPSSDLSYGTHTVTWHATDGAGNVRDGFWTFVVRDAVPPVLSDVRPDDGSSTSDATPAVSVAVADAGVGVDPASIVMTVDGNDVSAHGAFAGGRFTYTPSAPLGFGPHTVVVRASDLAGNRSAPLQWSFDERDDTPPAIAGGTPVAGSTVPGASAIGVDVSDAGAGVDPAIAARHARRLGRDVLGHVRRRPLPLRARDAGGRRAHRLGDGGRPGRERRRGRSCGSSRSPIPPSCGSPDRRRRR